MSSPSLKGTLNFPPCWLQGDSISSIVCNYEGPSLENAEVVLLFSNGQRFSSAEATEIVLTEGDTDQEWTIDIKHFAPLTFGSLKYELFINFADVLIPLAKVTLYKGVWEVAERIPEPE